MTSELNGGHVRPNIIKSNLTISGAQLVKSETYYAASQTLDIPIYEVSSIHGLNRLIGYSKFMNKDVGKVLYRGQNRLYGSLTPSLMRGKKYSDKCLHNLKSLVNKIMLDSLLNKQFNLPAGCNSNRSVIEGALQHYGISTRFIDLVDNHWTALWMSLYEPETIKSKETYTHYKSRYLDNYDLLSNIARGDNDPIGFGYLLMVCVPEIKSPMENGLYRGSGFELIDLRRSLPSIFLRPHAQHAYVLRRRGPDDNNPNYYDVASQLIGIAKIRLDYIAKWLGNGGLLTQNNLFPQPCFDPGYEILLSRTDLFDSKFAMITKYV